IGSGRIRIACLRSAPESEFKIRRSNAAVVGSVLQAQFVEQDLVENQFANLAIDLPDALIERWHHSFVLGKDFIGNFGDLVTQILSIQRRQVLSTTTLKEPAQNVVQQLAGIDGLQIERGLAAWFESQDACRKESK